MSGPPIDLAAVSYFVSGLGFAALSFLVARTEAKPDAGARVRHAALAALVSSALWEFLSAFDRTSNLTAPGLAAATFDLVRYGAWLAVLVLLLQGPPEISPDRPHADRNSYRWPRQVASTLLTVAAAVLVLRLFRGDHEVDASRLYVASALTLPMLGLVLVEQLFRNLADDSRWLAKPVCLALGSTFAFDVYLYSEALLLGRIDPDAQSIRGAVHLIAVPLLFLAGSRRSDWVRSLQVSRRAAFYSATLLLAGGYLLFLSAVGYYVRYFGGEWGRALQLGLLFAGVVFLVLLALSASVRARVRVFVGKHFFSYRYDYRENGWHLRTCSRLAQPHAEVGIQVVGLGEHARVSCGKPLDPNRRRCTISRRRRDGTSRVPSRTPNLLLAIL
jgi:putative PEP-CTERM system histidine kinase